MLQSFVSNPPAAEFTAETADLEGEWTNEFGSRLALTVASDGSVRGKYWGAAESTKALEGFPVVGLRTGTVLSLTAHLWKDRSVMNLVGHYTEENGWPAIKAVCMLAKNVADQDDPTDSGSSIITGYNHFMR